MIEGLYEAHLPVADLDVSIDFYKKIGLKFAWRDEVTAFFWIEENKSWVGLWEGNESKIPYHPSLRHIAFRVSYQNMKRAISWLQSLQIEAVPFRKGMSIEPFVRPHQGNASVYFQDPDGNGLELMCSVEVPDRYKQLTDKLSLEEWEALLIR
ncbi:VOC family protein [Peribacillus sp. SI8-4]|uniref:VOC family protein n=1 Tax=Peribacillus sp. SI8-4 TaxID=3048009 RepID=UPI0025566F72|nr:VOC family protein [Peribacillus sp. SI8-4]